MTVREFMTTNLEIIEASASVYDAIEKMVDKRIRSLVIEPQGKEDKRGVITARDIVCKVLAKDLDPKKIRVSDIASKPLIYIEKDKSIKDAADIMEKLHIARVFVCHDDKIIGVFSLMDAMQSTLVLKARENHV